MNTLPTWEECSAARIAGVASALENFIYNQEPAGLAESASFRGELTEVIERLTAEAYAKGYSAADYKQGKRRAVDAMVLARNEQLAARVKELEAKLGARIFSDVEKAVAAIRAANAELADRMEQVLARNAGLER